MFNPIHAGSFHGSQKLGRQKDDCYVKICFVGAGDIKIGEKVDWYVKVCERWTCASRPSHFADVKILHKNPTILQTCAC